jgi:hypothetical protein
MSGLHFYSGVDLPAEVAARLDEIERRFQERAFGEELARVNLDMTETERLAYVAWMRETARQHGIDPRRESIHAWMDRLEEQQVGALSPAPSSPACC